MLGLNRKFHEVVDFLLRTSNAGAWLQAEDTHPKAAGQARNRESSCCFGMPLESLSPLDVLTHCLFYPLCS